MSPSSPPTERPEADASTIRLDLVGGAVLIAIATFFLVGAGEGTLDWIFPTTLSYGVGAIGLILVVRSLLGHSRLVSPIPPILRGKGRAVAVFILIMVVYVILIRPVGFWPMSVAMIFVTAAYLAPERSRRSVLIAAGSAVVAVILGYLLLEYVFFVPFPEPRWLPL